MPKLTVNGVLVLAFLAAAPAAGANSPAVVDGARRPGLGVELGHADFIAYCAACHGVGGRGDGTVAEFLTIEAADLTQLRKRNGGYFPRERMIEVIDGRADVKVHGPRDMPVWGDWFKGEAASSGARKATREEIVSERIDALIAYIETIQEH